MEEVPEEGVEVDKWHTNIHLACVGGFFGQEFVLTFITVVRFLPGQ